MHHLLLSSITCILSSDTYIWQIQEKDDLLALFTFLAGLFAESLSRSDGLPSDFMSVSYTLNFLYVCVLLVQRSRQPPDTSCLDRFEHTAYRTCLNRPKEQLAVVVLCQNDEIRIQCKSASNQPIDCSRLYKIQK